MFVNRIQWGVFPVLAQLGATRNWHAIHREYLYGDAPRTELGQLEVATWRSQPGVGAVDRP